ncbi:MAG: calcium-binding protein, partial [Pseudomonadota bacterium]
NDTITDMDGENRIFWTDSNGIPHVMKTFYKSGDAEWTSPDGTVEVNKHSPYKIVLPDGGTITLGEDFQPGDFGIQLKDAPQVPTTTNTIFGDQNPQDLEDVLTGTTGNDRIEGRDDDDTISSLQGDDVLLGGTGRDAISAGEGNDILEGGAGSDILFGEEGNDQVYGENAGLMFDLISAGENATSIDQTGDLIVGNEGDDQLYGSNSNDALLGGEGHDLLAGGGGNDVIYGDYDSSGAYIDWDFKVTPDDITLRRSGNNMVVLPHIMNNSQNSNMHHILFS